MSMKIKKKTLEISSSSKNAAEPTKETLRKSEDDVDESEIDEDSTDSDSTESSEDDEEDEDDEDSSQSNPLKRNAEGEIFERATKTTRYKGSDGTTILRAGQKPLIQRSQIEPSPLLSRLKAFMPEMAAANEELEAEEGSSRRIEVDDDEAEEYIEMNLGLGVLEEKDPADEKESDGDAVGDFLQVITGDKDAIQKALDKPKRSGIQEVDDT